MKVILKFIRPECNQVFNVANNKASKYITRIKLEWSHLAGNKYKHTF